MIGKKFINDSFLKAEIKSSAEKKKKKKKKKASDQLQPKPKQKHQSKMEAVGRRKKGEPTSEGKKEKKIYIFFREGGERKREWVVYVEFYRDQNAEILPPVFPYNLQTSPFLLAFFSFLLLFLCSSSLSLFFSLLFSFPNALFLHTLSLSL